MHDEAGRNCLSHAFVAALTGQVAALADEAELRVLVLSGLPSVFCGGADLATLQSLGENRLQPVDILLTKTLLDIPVPVIAAMEGHAVGGGLAVGLCADLVVLAEESRYGCSFMNLGFTPGMGITRLMEHFMAPAVAHELLYTGTNLKGRDLRGKTHFNYILPQAEVLPKAFDLARALAEKTPQTLRLLKRYLSLSRRKLFEETHSIESMMHEISFRQQDILTSIQENYVR
jgi:polyketide biosynthesis enoyl-CoA hydratase PksI